MNSLENEAKKLFSGPGVYSFKDRKGGVLYVGKSINVQERIFQHLKAEGEKSKSMVSSSCKVDAIPVASELEALLLEAELIKKYLPKFNSRAKDDKHALYIKITKNDVFPKVLTSRKGDDSRSLYFGPFPSSSTVKKVLRQIRKVIPYCTQKSTSRRECLYSHLRLCSPCPSYITKVKDKDNRYRLTKIYKNNINKIIDLLMGKKTSVKRKLEHEMNDASKRQHFEDAARIRNQITELEYITQPFRNPAEYMANPNLLEDLREREINSLYKALKNNIENLNLPERIECFDVSHLSGTLSTSSMVTFMGGVPNKNFYRQFKIYGQKTNDDYYMMYETVKRRIKHFKDWGTPDLIVVDGGKPQITAAKKAFVEIGVNLPLVGLAKKLETIIVPRGEKFLEINLNNNDPAIHLLQRLRDEAHRFARKYHFKLRFKSLVG